MRFIYRVPRTSISMQKFSKKIHICESLPLKSLEYLTQEHLESTYLHQGTTPPVLLMSVMIKNLSKIPGSRQWCWEITTILPVEVGMGRIRKTSDIVDPGVRNVNQAGKKN